MLHTKILRFLLLSTLFTLCSCDYLRERTAQDFFTGNWETTDTQAPTEEAQKFYESNVPLLKQPSSIVVCRSRQCASSKLSMSKEYIYNSLLQLFDNNNYQKILVCRADAQTHTCLENYITLPIHVGIVPTNSYIDYIKITDVIAGKQNSAFNLILNYNLTYGGQVAECTPSQSLLFARQVNHVIMEDAGYNCKMTTIGTTNVKTVFAIDYIDLDYGYIGGYYSIGFSGPAYGGGNGYMMLRLPKNAYPLSPALMEPQRQPNSRAAIVNPSAPSASENNPISYANGVQVFPIEKK
jgi:hypothetical protein